MPDVLKGFSTRQTPQSQPAGGANAKNAAGGFVFAISDLERLRRFLILGTDGGTYYTKAPELTRQNAEVVVRMAENDPTTLVDTIVEISVAGRAPRQNPAIFALAIAASLSNDAGRAYALSKVNAVCRTGTHLYLFAGYVRQFRGWGRGLKRAVGSWYTSKPVDKLAYQLLKYRQREGWMHRDLLRLSHVSPYPVRNPEHPLVKDMLGDGPAREALHGYLMHKAMVDFTPSEHALAKYGEKARSPHAGTQIRWDLMPQLVDAYEKVQTAGPASALRLIAEHDLSWEMLPDQLLTRPETWAALIDKGMPQTALMRQLPRLTRLGLTTGVTGIKIARQLQDAEQLKRGRVHPISVLVANRTYASGRSARGESTWTPTAKIVDALDAAFYAAYGAVEPTGKRILLACDVSGSMGSAASGLPISCREAVAALALVTLNVEKDADIIGFSDGRAHGGGYGFTPSGWSPGSGWGTANSMATRLDISPRRRLDDVCSYMAGLNFGRTDCALPMLWADHENENYDALWTLTDNETWFGQVHPHQALKAYRQRYGDTRYGVVAMTATGMSIADPNDAGSIDVAGFDTNVPQVISNFSAGLI
jgi:60 kDa SS-A/Ro ribonucleoprotein